MQSILSDWDTENHIRAYAKYWNHLHLYLHNLIQENSAAKIIKYDNLCSNPSETISDILQFCALKNNEITDTWKDKISAPDYYQSGFTDEEKTIIEEHTNEAKNLFWPT